MHSSGFSLNAVFIVFFEKILSYGYLPISAYLHLRESQITVCRNMQPVRVEVLRLFFGNLNRITDTGWKRKERSVSAYCVRGGFLPMNCTYRKTPADATEEDRPEEEMKEGICRKCVCGIQKTKYKNDLCNISRSQRWSK